MKILFGLILLFSITFAYAEPKHYISSLENKPDNVFAVYNNFEDIDTNKQDAKFKVFATTPTLTDIPKNGVVLHEAAGVYHIYIRIGSDLIMFTGQKVN